MAPTIHSIRRIAGIAGSYGLSAEVQYPDEPRETLEFIGNAYGGPIVMVTPGNPAGVFVSPSVTARIGTKLTPEWVRAFFA